jgi:hypothetical protein
MFIDEGFGPRILQKGYSNFSTSKSFIIPVLIDENMTISGNHTINGYLVDENYFAGCGGGSSSNNSNTNIVTREFTTTFDASSSSDTIYISQLTGDSINKLSIEIIDVSWSTINDQDVLLSINSNASNKTINSGQLEIRGDLNGNTVVQGYPRSSVSSGLKAMKKLIISGDNPFLIFEPYSYIGTGGSGTITIWIKAAF